MTNLASWNGKTLSTMTKRNGIAKSSRKSRDGLVISVGGATNGYSIGGYTTGASPTAHIMVFSTGAIATNTASNLSQGRFYPGGFSDKTTYGYVMGGHNGSVFVKTADRIVFSTSITSACTISNLSTARDNGGTVSDGATYGYAMGGNSTKVTDRIVFSTSVMSANTASNLTQNKYGQCGMSDSVNGYGYATGGATSSGQISTFTDRIVFSTSITSACTTSNLVLKRNYLGGNVSDVTTYGYIFGGDSVGNNTMTANTERMTFSTGICSSNTISNLSLARNSLGGFSDGVTYGYMLGGGVPGVPGVTGVTDRIVFSTSVTSAYTSGNIVPSRATYASNFSDFVV